MPIIYAIGHRFLIPQSTVAKYYKFKPVAQLRYLTKCFEKNLGLNRKTEGKVYCQPLCLMQIILLKSFFLLIP